MPKKARPKKSRPGLEGLVAKPGAAAQPSAIDRFGKLATDAAEKMAEMDHPEGVHRALNEVRQNVGPVLGAIATNAPTSAPKR
jgi:hypothetical protein